MNSINATIDVNQLRDAISKMQGVVDKRNSRPILSNTYFKFSSKILELYATDLEVSLKIICDIDCDFEYNCCLSTKSLFEILRELPEDKLKIVINKENNIFDLFCRDIHFTLLMTNADDYPQLVFPQREHSFDISTNILTEIINKTTYSISNDETRLFLNGLFFQQSDGLLRVVATDGHRLALYDSINLSKDIEELINGVIVPKKGIYELKKIIEATTNSKIKLSFDETFLYINVENNTFLSVRLISRDFPKYQAVIPNQTEFKLNVNTIDLLNAVKRIKIMSSDKSHAIKLIFNKSNLKVEANHPTLGKATETINATFNGPEFEIGFNAKYLIDAINSFDTDQINFELLSETKPVIINSDEISNYISIIMPLKI